MKFVQYVLIILLLVSVNILSQVDTDVHKWKPLHTNSDRKLWYDEASLENSSGSRFEVWILETHTPPLQFDGIKGDVYRSKTLYAVNLETVYYGILRVIYYSVENKELFKHNYDTAVMDDQLRYTYPVYENSFIYPVIKEYLKMKGTDKSETADQ